MPISLNEIIVNKIMQISQGVVLGGKKPKNGYLYPYIFQIKSPADESGRAFDSCTIAHPYIRVCKLAKVL